MKGDSFYSIVKEFGNPKGMSFKVGDKVGWFVPGEVIEVREDDDSYPVIVRMASLSNQCIATESITQQGVRFDGERPTFFHLEDIKNMEVKE